MAYARQAQRGVTPLTAALAAIAAVVAALVIAGIVAVGDLDLFGPRPGQPTSATPHVLASARMWEIERLAQSGYLEPAVRSAREWEKQRRQQSPFG
jgi:hypothetical protein